MASPDLYVGAPQRVQLGVLSSTQDAGVQLVTSGQVEVRLTAPPETEAPPIERSATYVPAPGTDRGGADVALSDGAGARGLYEADDVTFDAAGVWTADVSFELGGQEIALSTQFAVRRDPVYPAPGERAPRTENLTMDSDAPAQAIDSRAQDGAPVPDPELHHTTIAAALDRGKPILAVFATPVYCESQFCGPVTDAVQQIADEHPGEAAFIHVEIWRNYHQSVINAGAAEWLLHDGDLVEPWLYLIGPDGTIVDRWAPLFDVDEVTRELDAVTKG
jgi:hypothetical protein